MKKTDKSKYGKMLLEIFKVIGSRIAGVEKAILFIAENNGGYMFGGTLGQMEKILELTDKKDKLLQMDRRLKDACRIIMEENKDLFVASVHPDVAVREKLTRKIKHGLKYRIYFNRMFDKMTSDLFDRFFDGEWTLDKFLDFYKDEPCVKRGLEIAEHYYEKRKEASVAENEDDVDEREEE